jgi:hypothetical protein
MKKIILCSIVIFCLIGIQAQPGQVIGKHVIATEELTVGDSTVIIIFSDTLVNPAWVRVYVANNSPAASLDTIYVSGQNEWVGNNDTIYKVDSAVYALNATKDSTFVLITVTEKMVTDTLDANIVLTDSAKIGYQTTGNTIIDSTSVTADTSTVNNYLDVNGNSDLNGVLFTGSTKTNAAFYTGVSNPTNTTRLNYDGEIYTRKFIAANGIGSTIPVFTFHDDQNTGISYSSTDVFYMVASGSPILGFGTKESGVFYSGTTDPTNTSRVNYDGNLHTTNMYTDTVTAAKAKLDSLEMGGETVGGFLDLKDAVEAEQFTQFNFKDTTFSTQSDGRLYKDEGTQSLVFQNDVTGFNHNLGYEFVRRVYNGTGSTIPSLRAVRRVGTYSNGDIIASVALAGNSTLDSSKVYGITTVSIAPGTIGIVTRGGDIRGENTTSINDTSVYLGFAGVLVDTCPPPPYLCVPLGECIYSDNDSGQVDVDIKEVSYSPSPLFVADTSGINQDVTIITQNVYEYLPLSDCNINENFGFTVVGDSIQVNVAGYYQIVLSMSFQGNPTTEVWHYSEFIDNVALPYKERSTSSSATGDANVPHGRRIEKDSWVSFRIKNTSGTGDPTIQTMAVQILFLHL